ncbi:MAG: hypothetical protein EOP07_02995 [Proteobacteria bacterium]|nr:MAG: hypothetical protein EOP07_02995 [Pseudomonadota bacterium]
MASWQYNLIILPRTKLEEADGQIPKRIDQNKINSSEGFPSFSSAVELLDNEMQRSLKEKGNVWGDKDSFCVSLYFNKNQDELESISLRFDLNKSLSQQIRIVLDLLRATDGVLVDEFSFQTILSSEDAVRWAIMRSDAAKFVTDPRQYFIDAKKRMQENPDEE